MAVHVPPYQMKHKQKQDLMLASNNILLNPKDGKPLLHLQDMVLVINYYLIEELKSFTFKNTR